jgi:hypothetical protein
MDKISKCNIVKKMLSRGRWFVTLDRDFYGEKRIPHAQYVWLTGNPSFLAVPKHYVVHHLDHDSMNDDISNLVLMDKHHHMAHHVKQRTVNSKVDFKYTVLGRRIFVPSRKPTVWHLKKGDQYSVCIHEKVNDIRELTRMTKRGDFKIATKEDAEKVIDEMWAEFKAKGFITA